LEKRVPNYLSKISVFQDVFDTFLPKSHEDFYEMSTSSISNHNQFVRALNLLEANKRFFEEHEYYLILEKIYSVIGVKPNLLKMFIDIGSDNNGE